MRNPTYLFRNSYGIWYFRIAVPKHLQYILHSKQIKRSLRTLNRVIAVRQARKFAVVATDLFETPNMTKEMFYNDLKVTRVTHPDGTVTETVEMDPEHPDSEIRMLKAHRETERAPVRTAAELQERAIQRNQHERIKFSDAAEKYKRHIDIQDKWTDKTKDENTAIYEAFVFAVTDVYMDTVDARIAEDFIIALKSMPKNRVQSKAYRKKSMAQLQAMKIPKKDLISKSTVNKYIRRISQFIIWAISSRMLTNNPFSKLSLKDRGAGQNSRIKLEDKDISALVAPENFIRDAAAPHKFWLPILAAFSGARLEELCQLRVKDIVMIDGIQCLKITNAEDDQEVKTESSKRTIPIHSKVLELGFVQYVAYLKLQKRERVFPHLSQDKYGNYSSSYSKHFTRYRRRCGVDDGKAFHSFRHSVATKLKHAEAEAKKAAAVIGHYDGENFTFRYYADAYLPEQLIETVETIDYGTTFDSLEPWKTI